MKIKDLPKEDKPREKLISKGAESLTDSELFAIIIGVGNGRLSALELSSQIINAFDGIKGISKMSIQELEKIPGIGKAKSSKIIASLELSNRIKLALPIESRTIHGPKDLFEEVCNSFAGKTREYLYLISLDSRNRVCAKDLISVGTINETLIHPREVFSQALKRNAVKIALAHNHPSGDVEPSEEDINITKKIESVGKEIGIPVLDHLVVWENTFISIKSIEKGGVNNE